MALFIQLAPANLRNNRGNIDECHAHGVSQFDHPALSRKRIDDGPGFDPAVAQFAGNREGGFGVECAA
jgi:hypothetical protein